MPDLHDTTEIAPGYVLEAPGLEGTAEPVNAHESATRGDGGVLEGRLQDALDDAAMDTELLFTLHVEADHLPPDPTTATRSDGLAATTRDTDEPAMRLSVPDFGPGTGYVVLYIDEAGISRWILPEPHPDGGGGGAATRGGGPTVTFHLPRAGAPAPPDASTTTRGPIAQLGRRVVRVLTWATDPIIGAGVRAAAQAWEAKKRPYGLHAVSPGQIGGPIDWDTLDGQRPTLLLIHGTFSTAEGGFHDFVESPQFADLFTIYQGRVLAFDYPSLHHDPAENIQTLLDLLPRDRALTLTFDLLTHSRGGLVGRELAERVAERDPHGHDLRVRRAVFVAAPHRGTILTDGDHWIELIDRYTNLLAKADDNVFTLTIEALLTVIKLAAHGGLKGLPGLQAMFPSGEYLARLNAGPEHGCTYHAITSDFTPTDENLLQRIAKRTGDRVVDKIFEEANDLVVPTAGSYEAGDTSPGFPIATPRVFKHIHHVNYFTDADVNDQIKVWLS